jgi:hypothetical protein
MKFLLSVSLVVYGISSIRHGAWIADAFVTPSHPRTRPMLLLWSSTVDREVTTKSNSTSSNDLVEPLAGTWECDENAECVQVPECTDDVCRTSLDVRIHGQWYDLAGTFNDGLS